MDSVSDRVLTCGAVLVVHAYKDGYAPGLARIEKLKLPAILFRPREPVRMPPSCWPTNRGRSLLAVGLHSNLIDFLEKGRQGMASTLLVRLKVGPILVDAKGVNQLYRGPVKLAYLGGVFLAGLFPFLVTVLVSTRIQYFLQLMLFKIRLLVGL